MIELLQKEIKDLEIQLKKKKEHLANLKLMSLESESKRFQLTSFLGQAYIFDKPFKWSHHNTGFLSSKEVANFSYLKYNGIITGNELNALYKNNWNSKVQVLPEDVFVTYAFIEEEYDFSPDECTTVADLLILKIT